MNNTDPIEIVTEAIRQRCDVTKDLYEQKWEDINDTQDWRKYVPKTIRSCWDQLDTVTMCSVYLMAYEQSKTRNNSNVA